MLIRQVPEIGEAFEILKVVSRNKKTRRDYEIREKAPKRPCFLRILASGAGGSG